MKNTGDVCLLGGFLFNGKTCRWDGRNKWLSTRADMKKEPKRIKRLNDSNIVFIVLLTVLGSQAIHVLSIKQEFKEFEEQIDAKISLLRNVIDRIQRGEEVDVPRELGTGVVEKEKEWSDVMQQIIEQNEE
ncbi:hypothetical protein PORY_001997 [Pneumocystis oryctolagi]|uniref:Uncharacterized protein n=1 Tax=Pneumocystis oryctolagi TaxID=42067 RepID=A0ACB7CCM2_9ASCO|nr:hypothetical protein PORY_001997 [Pneumocystis oryctolagi]